VDIRVTGRSIDRGEEILTPEALDFVAALQAEFGSRRDDLLARRRTRREEVARTGRLDFLEETRQIREGDWQVAKAPEDLLDRRVEITGPTDRKMTINALNSGARVWLADHEDASTPHWSNVVGGQVNLKDAIRRDISFTSDGKSYELDTDRRLATIVMRPRGWHFDEAHITVDGAPVVGALVDFGLYFFHNAQELIDRGSGPYFYLPKLESHLEARLWNRAFELAQDRLGIPRGTIKATVLIETITAAFEMDEILYELRDHSAGLNAGRWDYMFSVIKKFRNRSEFTLPDRNKVTMTVPFMRAYTELLVKTCHRREAPAIGGMAAFIPSRRDPKVNEVALAKVREDKQRESGDGFDGTWVAHPDLVPVAMECFDAVLGDRPNQIERKREEVRASAADLLNVAATGGEATEEGLRNDVSVAIQYLSSWLRGTAAVGIFNLMEDAATSEIARSQVWQWVHNQVRLAEGPVVTPELVRRVIGEELEKLRRAVGDEVYAASRAKEARELFERVALNDDFVEFLTLPAYDYLD
jgi:malate synthase